MSEPICKIFVPYGALGTGITDESFEAGVALGPDAIVCDAGSTDSGPYYLGTGRCKYARDVLKEDFTRMVVAGHKLGVPVMVGSAGTCGTDKGVDDLFDICKEICAEQKISAKVALVYCSQDGAKLKQKYLEGKIKPLPGAPAIDESVFEQCTNIVGLAGAEPFIQALRDGADIVICGRATDTAILAALPLMKGCGEGACWHGAKTAECGSICTTNPAGGVFLTFDKDSFTIEPTCKDSACTPYSVSAHMIYENSNPYQLREPSGLLDTTGAKYEALDERRVRVSGDKFTHMDYTIKLEGSSLAGYQTVTVVGLRDKRLMKDPEHWLSNLKQYVSAKMGKYHLDESVYTIDFKMYGYNAVSPVTDPDFVPEEIGLVMIVTARDQALATRIAKIYNPYLLHFPVKLNEQLPSFALLFSPAEIEKGPVYEFRLNHAVDVENPMELFSIRMEEIV